ncbi:MAG: serine/threonine-protein phosphatase [Rhodanobacteraceae bacterium]|jgi:protein phosphatase|nr:serine/threonine-protein phosphatase [Rhodanobacteraceae bacterium]
MIEFGHRTHVGLRREHNEDTYYADGDLGLWLVADGMGGHEHGEVASALARDVLVREVGNGVELVRAIQIADEEIIRHSTRRSEALPMGTTIAALRVTMGNQFEVAWVGDSRVYVWDEGGLRQLSQDHSYVQELVAQGAITSEQARSHPHRNVVTQALGVTDPQSLRVESLRGELRPGMQMLLCSDGLTEEVKDGAIAAIVARQDLTPQECVEHLILAALDGGGSDNVTVILVRVR